MSEREIREIIAGVCADLDRQIRAVMSRGVRTVVLPAALGAGLALSAAACDGNGGGELYGAPAYGAPPVEASVSDQGVDEGPAVLYGVPDGGAPTDGAEDATAAIDGGSPDDAADEDGGAASLYSAP